MSLFWAGMNKGKRSFQVDIGHAEGRELIMELLRGDSQEDGIFLTNFPERGWLAYEKLKQVREDLIYVNIMGDRKGGSALDYTVNCAVGFASATGDPSNEDPTNYLLPAWDNITGQMSAVALLAADRYRRINGEGQLVKIALKDVAVATASNLGNISEVTINNEDRQKAGNYLYGAFGRDFVSKDGVRVMIVGLTPRQWEGIVESMGIADQMSSLEIDLGYSLSGEGERFKARHKIAELVEPWFACKAYSEICPLFDEHAVCYGPYRSFREMVEDDDDCSPDNPMMGMVTQPNIGEYLASGSPIRFVDDNLQTLPAPTLGQHTEEILKQELSLSDGEVGRLKAQGIVAW
jgi:2-methylfumaryl-CoA isomerase